MPWLRFVKAFDYRVKSNVILAYPKNSVHFVKRECAERAIAAGAAELTERPKESVDGSR